MNSKRGYLVPTYYFLGVATGTLVLIYKLWGAKKQPDYTNEYNHQSKQSIGTEVAGYRKDNQWICNGKPARIRIRVRIQDSNLHSSSNPNPDPNMTEKF